VTRATGKPSIGSKRAKSIDGVQLPTSDLWTSMVPEGADLPRVFEDIAAIQRDLAQKQIELKKLSEQMGAGGTGTPPATRPAKE
jgi:hypothetical protein